jgi:cyclophilin family peptidyl-prolyl cis-trans isomerase
MRIEKTVGRVLAAVVSVCTAAVFLGPALAQSPGKPKPSAPAAPATGAPAGPVVVVETVKGTFAFETYPDAAPKTVDHVVRLARRGFYNGQRVHRAVPNFVVQMGDPQTRDMTKREWWGRGDFAGSGRPVGAAEISKKHLHVKGAVAMAHAGNPAEADAQFYVVLAAAPRLNGKYSVFGRVVEGVDVPAKLQVGDMIKKVSVRTPPAP